MVNFDKEFHFFLSKSLKLFKVDELTHDLIEEQNVNQDTSEQLEHEIKERLRWQNEFNLEKQRADEVEKVIICFIYIWGVVKRPHFGFIYLFGVYFITYKIYFLMFSKYKVIIVRLRSDDHLLR